MLSLRLALGVEGGNEGGQIMKKVYIAHPLRGENREKNVAEVTKICKKITELFPDVLPVSPIHAFSFLDNCGAEGEKKALELCLETLKNCDEAWFFGEWETSYGCELEWRTARDCGLAVKDLSPKAAAHKRGVNKIRDFLDWLLSEVYAEAEPLKPCPFCGAEAKIMWRDKEGGEGKIACLNQKCPVLVRIEWGEIRHCSTKAEAIAAWNRRAGE